MAVIVPHTARLRRFFGGTHQPRLPTSTVLICGLLFLFITTPMLVDCSARSQHPRDGPEQYESRICKSLDIRNSLDAFKRLKNCEVIEGFLQVLLFDNVNETELMKLQFPLLTEITDFLLLFRVNGLRSVGQLFPNLAVIRGQNLFLGHAFVIFEMSTLQEIGLYSLTDITHGTVRIDKNPSLCFSSTLDWENIVHARPSNVFIKKFKPDNECPMCPSVITPSVKSDSSITTIRCPRAPRTSGEKDKYLCWNKNHCQKICPDNCTVCNYKGQCCNQLCLGGCSNDDPNICTVCRNFTMGIGRNRRCMQNCPTNHYQYLNRRCITKEQCINMPKPIELQSTSEVEKPFKIFNNTCILHCPVNYMSDYEKHTCVPCGGRCKKVCDGINIDSITIAKQLRGCTHIKGSLEIQIRGGTNIVKELDDNLSMIEEITGYLKVVRSFSLVSLNFFKSLKVIKGEELESGKYVFILFDNQNIIELWDWSHRTLKIERGRLFFHFNPKLCLNKIRKLQEIANLHSVTDLDVAPNSNGDKTACNIKNLPVNVTNINTKSVTLEWEQFHMDDDQRKLLAYSVYIIESPYRNLTFYDGRDACGQDDWRVYDVTYEEGQLVVVQLLPNLKPYTQYAFYVKTYTIASENNGAQSEIMYFTTLPSMPSQPQNLQVISNSSDSLRITWASPAQPNGHITHYIVSGKKHLDDYLYSEDRDYCKYTPSVDDSPISSTTPPPKNDTCQCQGKEANKYTINELEEEARIRFEDEVHNKVYIKRPRRDVDYNNNKFSKYRVKRDSSQQFPYTTDSHLLSVRYHEIQNHTENGTDIWESFSFPIFGKTELFINKLHHFTYYEINVQACRRKEGEQDTDSPCSSTSMQTSRTLRKSGADNISKIQITNKSLDTITITWDPPQDPNGIISHYSVEYKRIDIENMKYSGCITAKKFSQRKQYTISSLLPGNYSLRVISSHQASPMSNGFSSYIYFDIEEPSSNTVLIISMIILVFLSITVCFAWLYRKHQRDRENMRLIQTVNPEYVPSVYIPDDWEVPRSNIELVNELGQGSFGMVWEGVARDIRGKSEIRCAVKTVNEHATNRERLEFLNEASVMKTFDTAHVVRLLGVVSQGQPTLVIMELMANGDLKSYLRSHRPDVENFDPNLANDPPTLNQILKMAIEIADGMAYLSNKKFVHRDLAARNCMVSEDLVVKIGDFGMTRDIYETDYYRKGTKGLLPVRWMAPESLKDGVFSSSSDVWSYGVVLWEMATLASQPYQGLANDQVLRYVIDGGIMARPENCPDELYILMRKCWQHIPSTRLSFLEISHKLLQFAGPTFAQVSFYHSPAGVEARSLLPTRSQDQDDPCTPLRSSELLGGFLGGSENFDVLGIDTHHQFPSLSDAGVDVTGAANGYISGCPTTGAATSEC